MVLTLFMFIPDILSMQATQCNIMKYSFKADCNTGVLQKNVILGRIVQQSQQTIIAVVEYL